MNLTEYIAIHDKVTPSRWMVCHQSEMLQARQAIERGVEQTLVYQWLTDHCDYPGGLTTFRTLARQWKKEATSNVRVS